MPPLSLVRSESGRARPASLEQAAQPWGWVGIWAVLCGAVLLSYYAVVMGWRMDYLAASFTLAWGEDTESFFLKTVLGVASELRGISSLSVWVILGLVASWAFIFFCVFQGVRSVSRVVFWTVALPYILVAILDRPGCDPAGGCRGPSVFPGARLEKALGANSLDSRNIPGFLQPLARLRRHAGLRELPPGRS